MNWQPIETAPKGETVLAAAAHDVYGWLWDKADYHRFPALKKEEWIMRNGLTPTVWLPLPEFPSGRGRLA